MYMLPQTTIAIIWVRICPGLPYNAPVPNEFMNGAANIPVAKAPHAPDLLRVYQIHLEHHRIRSGF